MVCCLLPYFNLSQTDACIRRRASQHCFKLCGRHEVTAAGRGEVAASWQKLHGPVVDLMIAALCIGGGLARFGKSRRIQNDQIIGLPAGCGQFRKEIKHIFREEVNPVLQSVPYGVFFCKRDRGLGDINRCDMARPSGRSIQGEGARMGETVKDAQSP